MSRSRSRSTWRAGNVEEQLVKTGHVVRGRIGVTIQDVNAQLAESFGLDRPHGALVSSVDKYRPAAHAGVIAGDVILSVAGHPIERYGELSGAIAAASPGRKRPCRCGATARSRR